MTVMRATLVLCILARSATADPDNARGEALFKQGVELKAAGKLAQACDAFEASEKADPNLGTLMYLADCREANQQLSSAWSSFLEAEKRTRNATDDESVQIHTAAAFRAAQLEPRLSKLQLVVPEASRVPGLDVRVDDEPFAPSSWNLDVPIDGQTHTITARAPGRIAWTTTVAVAIERDRKTVVIPLLKPAPVSNPVTTRNAPSKLPSVLIALGGAGLIGTGIAFEVSSGNLYRRSEAQPQDSKQIDLWEQAKLRRGLAIAGITAGLVAGGAAVWLWVRREHESRTQTAVAPLIATDLAGVQWVGAW